MNQIILRTGDVISMPGALGVRHFMICANPYYGYFIHNSKQHGRVVLEWFPPQALGEDVRLERRADPRWSSVIVERAQQLVGKPYDLFSFNCEHFVNVVYGEAPTSPQLSGGIVLSVAVAGIAAIVLGGSKRQG